MKKLQYQHYFSEHRNIPMAISFLLMLVNIVLCIKLYEQDRFSILLAAVLIFLLPLLVLTGLLFFCNSLCPAEREKMKQAAPIRWAPIDPQQFRKVKTHAGMLKLWWIFLFAAETLFLLILTVKLRNWFPSLIAALLMYLPTLIWLLWDLRSVRFWSALDGTAEAAKLPIDRWFYHMIWGRYGIHKREFCVCYLPDGRYIFEPDVRHPDMQTVVIVRFRGKYTYYVE